MGREEAERFLAADDFDFLAYNHGPDSGDSWDDAEAEVRRTHPHWATHAAAYRTHFAASLVGEVPGTADLVRELKAAGVPQWGLTNWSAELYPHAPARFDVVGLLDGVVVSGVEGVAKPDPAIFAITAQRSGLPLADLAFVDDRQSNVDAAVALGMAGVLFVDADDTRKRLRALGLPL